MALHSLYTRAVSAVLTAPTEHLVPWRSRALSRLGQLRPGTGKAP